MTPHGASGTLEWMPSAYFDTTVYDHAAKGVIPREETEAVAGAVSRGKLVVHPSVLNVEELLGQWGSSRKEAPPPAARHAEHARFRPDAAAAP